MIGARLGPRTPANRRWRARLGALGFAALLSPFLLFALVPIYVITVTAFKTNAQINTFSDPLWPLPWTMQQLRLVLAQTAFATWFRNSLIVGVATTAISMVTATLGAYALARLRWRGATGIATAILGTALVPAALFLFPLYLQLSKWELINTPWSLVVSYPSIQLPMACWLLLGFFRAVPEELEEVALLDGCTHLRTFLRIVLPLSWPGLVAVALFTFALSWNELMFAGFFLRSEANWTLPMGLALISNDMFPYGRIFGSSFMMALPVTICAAIGQRAMISGLTEGAVKGEHYSAATCRCGS